MQAFNGRTTELTFDVTNDRAPIVLVIDVERYAITDNVCVPPMLTLNIPRDKQPRMLGMYIRSNGSLVARLHLLVIQIPHIATRKGFMATHDRPPTMHSMKIENIIDSLTHAHPCR